MALAEGWNKEIALKDLHRWVQRNDLERMKWMLENGVDPSWAYGELRSEQPYRNAIEQADIDGNAEALALFADFETLSSQRALGMDLAQAATDNDLKKLKELMPRIKLGYRCALGMNAVGFAMVCIREEGSTEIADFLHANGAYESAINNSEADFDPLGFVEDAAGAENYDLALWFFDHDYGPIQSYWFITREELVARKAKKEAADRNEGLEKALPKARGGDGGGGRRQF